MRRTRRRVVYAEYLRSEGWQKKRRRALDAAGYRCSEEGCTQDKSLHVHHLTYARLGRERMTDLQVLCRKCHFDKHATALRKARKKRKKRKTRQPEWYTRTNGKDDKG